MRAVGPVVLAIMLAACAEKHGGIFGERRNDHGN